MDFFLPRKLITFLQVLWVPGKTNPYTILYSYGFIYANDEQLDFYQLKERYDKLIKITKALALIVMCFSEIIYAFSFRKKFLKESQVFLIRTIRLAANLVYP